ncbi:hypothetical protein SRABI27_03471 [Pedobacter sp. Bi27]|nr:hypothetical protein SRABI36_00929 [Pedobacter sp. Bi36]CAH0212917.1 hypothetical protein SRABI126_02021 [Pedobacter sp. Bi126]CAH0270238.1 hypothetical protein SRABI27_03471 [Pedobacter sp. Bi27]
MYKILRMKYFGKKQANIAAVAIVSILFRNNDLA